jgi:hypothetical protein
MPTSQGPSRRSANSSSQVELIAVPEFSPLVVRFLGPYKGLETHHNGKRSFPCPGQEKCPVSDHRRGTIWKGYAPTEWWDAVGRLWIPAVFEVTESAEETLRGRDLVGEVWSFSRRPGKGKTGAVLCLFCERIALSKLSRSFDIVPVLQRVYRVTDLRLGVVNALPEKILLPAVEGDAPNLPAELVDASKPSNTPEAEQAAREQWKRFREAGYRELGRDLAGKQEPQKEETHKNNGQHR